VQFNLENKVNFVHANILRNVLVPLVSLSSPKIPLWNKRGEDWILSIFDFTKKFLTIDGAMFLFYLDDS
jgi:hypothetical protein